MQVNCVHKGDCLEVMSQFPSNCIDTIITDPPYGLNFMGKDWDYGIPGVVFWQEILRVAKPGATLLAFGGTRTQHRLMCAIEDAGWQIRDCIMWVYGQGFSKSLDIGKAIDKAAIIVCPNCDGIGKINEKFDYWCVQHGNLHAMIGKDFSWNETPVSIDNEVINWAMENELCPICDENLEYTFDICPKCEGTGKVKGAERETIGERYDGASINGFSSGYESTANGAGGNRSGVFKSDTPGIISITAPATPLAQTFDGWGTALKPSYEPIVVAQKPIDGTYAANAEKWGVAGVWIEGSRIPTNGRPKRFLAAKETKNTVYAGRMDGSLSGGSKAAGTTSKGRWPSNLIHDGSVEVLAEFDKANIHPAGYKKEKFGNCKYSSWGSIGKGASGARFGDSGSPARFFYTAKASPAERGKGNTHCTVKPLALLKYLARLTKTPYGGIVLDPFAGSGTSALACIAEGRDYIMIEKEAEYVAIINRRIAEYTGQEIAPVEIEITETKTVNQLSLW